MPLGKPLGSSAHGLCDPRLKLVTDAANRPLLTHFQLPCVSSRLTTLRVAITNMESNWEGSQP